MTPVTRLTAVSSTLREDVDSLFDLAEKQRDRCEKEQKSLSNGWKLLVSHCIGFAGSLLAIVSLALTKSPNVFGTTGLFIGSLVITLFVYLISSAARRIFFWKRKLRQSGRVLAEVIELLREVEPAIAEEEGWSSLKKAEYRIRLSEYDIDSVANYKG